MKPLALRLLLAVTLLLLGALSGALSVSAQEPPTGDSAVTKSGSGEFADLKVTVGKTRNLMNESVTVSWTGGKQTVPTGEPYKGNFLQIMQCWGDDPSGPDRTQCQFGAIVPDRPTAGTRVRSRQVNGHEVDPLETLKAGDDPSTPADEGPFANAFVPFWAVGKERPKGKAVDNANEFFDAQVTNEVPVARTRGDGTGEVEFEVQTVREAAGLGCGEAVDVGGVTKGRSCWLVVVPRGRTEVDGTEGVSADGSSGIGLQTSPLSQTNWNNKIAVPLEFLPVGRACPLGVPERRLLGHELVVEAVSSWQPELCKGGGALYGLSQLSDDLSRRQLLEATDPGLTLMSRPVPPDQVSPDRPIVYAPVALSSLTFAFNIVKQPGQIAPSDPRNALLGVPFTEMKLTPRLVAKLLTQSYRGAISGEGAEVPPVPETPGRPARLQNNPLGLTGDPEFLALNPEYEGLQAYPNNLEVLVQLGTSDLTALLWDWVLADSKAKEFLSGAPDENGMVVNEFNKGIEPPLDVYPRNDQTCGEGRVVEGSPFLISNCTGDQHQFANDMHEAARAASRGDTLGRLAGYDSLTNLKKLSRAPRQSILDRSVIAVVDVATADRYGLRTASLRNSAGQFVAPDDAGLRAGLDAMQPSAVPGVLRPDPATTKPAAYPLTSLSYAATSPAALTRVAGREYATFLRYAAGPGQQPGILPGQLPFGYVPLPEPLRAQTLAAATAIETQAGKAASGDPPPENTPTGTGSTGTGSTGTGSTGTGSTGTGSTGTDGGGVSGNPAADRTPPAGMAPVATPPGIKTPGTEPVAAQRRTPALSAPAVGALLVALLVCGGAAAALAPLAHRYGATRRNDPGKGGDTADRTAARSRFSWRTARPALFARRR